MSEQPKPKVRKHHSKTSSKPVPSPSPPETKPVQPVQQAVKPVPPSTAGFTDFTIKEDSNYSQMKNNIITQSTRICEIVSDASKFGSFYNELTNNIVSSMNEMIRTYVKTGRTAILVDIYDELVSQTDWNGLKERFKAAMTDPKPYPLPKYTSISTDLKKFKIDVYDADVLVDMYTNMDEDTVKQFAKSQEEATNNLYELVEDVTAFENALCAYRTKTVATMKANIDVLFALHVNYAKAVTANSPKIPDTTTVNGKVIKFQKAQKAFICDALKTILIG